MTGLRTRATPPPRPPFLAAAAAAIVIVFAGAFGLHRYFDDWMFPLNAADAIAGGGIFAFVVSPVGHHWSPLWNAFEIANARLVGLESDAAIRALDLVAVACASWWFWYVARALRISTAARAVGVGVLTLHHVNAAAVYSFDTYSQVLADLATWVVAGQLLAIVSADDRRLTAADAAPLVLLAVVALLMKEQALAATACLVWLTVVAAARRRADRPTFVVLAVAVLAASGAFALARRAVGLPLSSEGAFRLCVGCAPQNVATLLGLLFLPVRSLVVYDAFRNVSTPDGRGRLIAAAAGAALVVIVVIGAALQRRRSAEDRSRDVAVAGLLIASCFPTALLAHVGELYAHTAVFWFALLGAAAFDTWRGIAYVRPAAVATAAVYLAALAIGLRTNLADMRANGERADRWLEKYAQALAVVPDGGVALVHGHVPDKNDGDFGLYRLTNPEYLMLELPPLLEQRLGNRVRVVPEWSAAPDDLRWALADGPVYDVWRRGDQISVQLRHVR